MMVLLTVIGRTLAKEGGEFIFMGPNSNCKECKVKTICFHLEPGTKYRVIGSRDVVHDCPQHEEGVVVVQVEETPRDAVISKKLAMEGTTITFEGPKCNNIGCGERALCFPVGMETSQKRQIIKVESKIDCPEGQSRVKVVLE